VKVGAGISTAHDPLTAGVEAARIAAAQLDEVAADLAMVFASGSHLAAPETTLEAVGSVLSPTTLIGCAAGGVLAAGREL
jgi:small ligand-binding sensory domain FIST